jgi:hypothetical protein
MRKYFLGATFGFMGGGGAYFFVGLIAPEVSASEFANLIGLAGLLGGAIGWHVGKKADGSQVNEGDRR